MLRVLLALIVLVITAPLALAERRVALVMGADRYVLLRPLENAANDAIAMRDALDSLGFEVYIETDRDLRRMRRALEDFLEDAQGADVALVFFAGHGVEINGENRLLPTDADPFTLERLKETSLALEEVREAVNAVARIGMIVLDACRDDPFDLSNTGDGRGAVPLAREVLDNARPGLGRVGRADNVLFAFSAAPGATAADGSDGNSPFTRALTKYLATEGLEIRSVLTLVQQEVYDLSGGQQLPYVESAVPATFFAASAGGEQLPERERLLLAMAQVTPAIRVEVEAIATDHGMPLAPLYAALVSENLAALDAELRAAKLRESAAAFVKVREEMRTLASGDPRVTALRLEAEEQLSLGAVDEALAKLDEAAGLDSASRDSLTSNYMERTLSEAATYYLSAGTARTDLRYDRAITDYEKAAALYAELVDEDISADDRLQHVLTLEELGNTHIIVGNIAAATRAFEAQLRVAGLRAATDPENLGWRRDLAVAYEKVGDVRVTGGNLPGALEAFEAGLYIRQNLSGVDPANDVWKSDLSISHFKIGSIYLTQGNLTRALEALEADLRISQELAAQFPDDARMQLDLGASHDKIGDVRFIQGNLAQARASFEAALDIRDRLAQSDPSNLNWQRSLSVSHERLGNVHLASNELDAALAAYQLSLSIREPLTARDPGNTGFQRDVSVAHEKIGEVFSTMGHVDEAIASASRSLEIRLRLAGADPSNTEWQRDLSVSHEKLGALHHGQGDYWAAVEAHRNALAIRAVLSASDPTNANWQRDLSVSYEKVGDALMQLGEVETARESYQACIDTRLRLSQSDPHNSEWQWDLYVAYWRMADVTDAKVENLEKGLAILESLHAAGRLSPARIPWIENTRAKIQQVSQSAQ
jgi:uncharacterized caspase-like protein